MPHTVIKSVAAYTPDGQLMQLILASCDGGNQYHVWQINSTTLDNVDQAVEFFDVALQANDQMVRVSTGVRMAWKDTTDDAAYHIDFIPEGN
jgi:hypothetical protein